MRHAIYPLVGQKVVIPIASGEPAAMSMEVSVQVQEAMDVCGLIKDFLLVAPSVLTSV